uniref:Uncharacterized protein n=1 Tax=Rangifer tarandus platyrhynchus TaxID=3082113 RepID=A0ACB0DZD9_RANTA|nr:unnamed protein product [Rangifer tarandus platyrhynchus]
MTSERLLCPQLCSWPGFQPWMAPETPESADTPGPVLFCGDRTVDRAWLIVRETLTTSAARGPQSPSGPLSAVADDSRAPITQHPSEPREPPAPAPALVPAGRKPL